MKRLLWFSIGVSIGVYIGQNYQLPNLKSATKDGFEKVKELEKNLRK